MFCEFMEEIKEGGKISKIYKGSDVDNWTLNDLESMVELFKRSEDDPKKTSKFKLQEFDLDVPKKSKN